MVSHGLAEDEVDKENRISTKARKLDDCEVLNEVQSSVIRILSTHYEYGKRIHLLNQLLHGVQQDIAVFKDKISRLEDADYGLSSEVQGRHRHIVESVSVVEPPDGGGAARTMEHSLSNITSTLQLHGVHFQQLDKKYKRLRRTLGKVTATLATVQAGQEASQDQARTLTHFLEKQKEINGQIINRIRDLESLQQASPQQDSPELKKLQANG